MHKLLFYTLMCRNYLEIGKKTQKEPCWRRTLTFPKSVPKQFLEIVSLTPEDDVKWKKLTREKCGEFSANAFRLKIRPKRSSDAISRPVLLEVNI